MNEARPVHVIDDDEAVRRSLCFMLEAAGFAARGWDGAEAFLQGRDREAAGCIVSDVRMPGLNGVELAQHLKALGATEPVILITGHGDLSLAIEAMNAGVADFIEKPFESRRLLDAVRTALDRISRTAFPETAGSQDRGRPIQAIGGLSAQDRQVLDGLVARHASKVSRTTTYYRESAKSGLRSLGAGCGPPMTKAKPLHDRDISGL